MFEVKERMQKGQTMSAVTRELGLDRKTVRKLAGATAAPIRRARARPPSKLDPFVGYLRERLAAGVTNQIPVGRLTVDFAQAKTKVELTQSFTALKLS